mmetsp:Transcript_42045/g.64431  ORF Transcript_42045/g.64431 Transcript_42045/m.64431 type:complete len:112 (+) Transcript_42045:323-658(+)
MHAQVDAKSLNLDGSTPAAPVQPAARPATAAPALPTSPDQQQKDSQLIQEHLTQFTGGAQPEMGSSILYSAINDLDLGEASIPAYTPPGMPPKLNSAQATAGANPWAVGVA